MSVTRFYKKISRPTGQQLSGVRRIIRMLLCILSALFVGNCCAGVPVLPRDYWMATYFAGKKVGYRHVTVESTTFLGKPAYHWRELMVFHAVTDVQKQRISMQMDHYLDQDFRPVFQVTVETSSDQRDPSVPAEEHTKTTMLRYGPDRVEWRLVEDGKPLPGKTVNLPAGADLAAMWKYRMGAGKLSVGDKIRDSFVDQSNCTLGSGTWDVVAREKLEIAGQVFDAFVVVSKGEGDVTKTWMLEDGKEVKSENEGTGFSDVLERREIVLADAEGEGPNLGNMCCIRTTPEIPDPDRVAELKVRIVGFPFGKEMIMNDHRQSAAFSPETNTVEYHIVAESPGSLPSPRLPLKKKAYAEYLGKSSGIDPNDQGIQRLVREVIGEERDGYTVISRLRAWVHDNIEASEETEPPKFLSATEILTRRSGFCRHKAVLYAALARAAGIPTRLVAGLIYREGCFGPHAWTESYLGKWIPVDPTLASEFVDATHIKLREGRDAEIVLQIAAVNRLATAELLSYKALPPSPTPTPNPCGPADTRIYCPDGSIMCVPPGGTNPGCPPPNPPPRPPGPAPESGANPP